MLVNVYLSIVDLPLHYMCDYMLSHKRQTEGRVRVLHDLMCYSFRLAVGNFWSLYLILHSQIKGENMQV